MASEDRADHKSNHLTQFIGPTKETESFQSYCDTFGLQMNTAVKQALECYQESQC